MPTVTSSLFRTSSYFQTNKQTNERTNERTNKQTNKQKRWQDSRQFPKNYTRHSRKAKAAMSMWLCVYLLSEQSTKDSMFWKSMNAVIIEKYYLAWKLLTDLNFERHYKGRWSVLLSQSLSSIAVEPNPFCQIMSTATKSILITELTQPFRFRSRTRAQLGSELVKGYFSGPRYFSSYDGKRPEKIESQTHYSAHL